MHEILLSFLSPTEGLPGFNKEYLTKQFIRGGGKVLEKYAEAEIILAEQGRSSVGRQATPKSKKKSTTTSTTLLLISNTYCRTAKYIQCLAAGIPIVSFQWVIASCAQVSNILLVWLYWPPTQILYLPVNEKKKFSKQALYR